MPPLCIAGPVTLLTVLGGLTSVEGLVAVEVALLGSGASGGGSCNWENRGGEGSRGGSEMIGRGESEGSWDFGKACCRIGGRSC